jgi:hypothetical protein
MRSFNFMIAKTRRLVMISVLVWLAAFALGVGTAYSQQEGCLGAPGVGDYTGYCYALGAGCGGGGTWCVVFSCSGYGACGVNDGIECLETPFCYGPGLCYAPC